MSAAPPRGDARGAALRLDRPRARRTRARRPGGIVQRDSPARGVEDREELDGLPHDPATWQGEPLRQRSLFVRGCARRVHRVLAGAIQAHATTLPGLVGSHLLEGVGHWVQQERPDEVSELLVRWLTDAG